MAFGFKDGIDPSKPLDPKDPPPLCWDSIETKEYRAALFGSPPDTFRQCVEWEKRELARLAKVPVPGELAM